MITNSQVASPTAGDIARCLFRHAKKAIVVFCMVMLLTVSWIVFSPSEYESVAKVYVRVGRESTTLDPSATTGQTLNIEQSFESEINSMLEILGSYRTAELVVEKVGVETILENDLPAAESGKGAAARNRTSVLKSMIGWVKGLRHALLPSRFTEEPKEKAIRLVLKNSHAWAPKKSNVIELAYNSAHPRFSQIVAQTMTDTFIEEYLRVTKTEGSLNFFVHQTESLKEQLETVEEDLADLKDACSLVSVDGQMTIVEEEAKLIRSRKLENQAQLDASKARVAELGKSLNAIPERVKSDTRTAENSQGWFSLRDRLFDLQIREQELKSRYSADNPEVKAIVEQRNAAEKILAEQKTNTLEMITTTNPAYLQVQQALLNEKANVVALLAERQVLESQLKANLEDFKNLNENARKITELNRQREILEDSYLASSKNMGQAKILSGLESAKISSIGKLQPASYSARRIGLGRFDVLLMGGFAGVFLGLVTMFVAEYFDRSFATPSQVESALNIPVLVSIPQGRRQLMEVN